MAIYHCKFKVINRKAGPGIVASAAYRAGEKIRDEVSGKTYNFKRRMGIVHTEIMSPKQVPEWVNNRSTLWNTVELTEKRSDAQLAREIMVALPKELDQGQQISLVRGFIYKEFIKNGMIADYAIHVPVKAGGDDRNYHAHILLTMRQITPDGFGGKVREWNAKAFIYQWRQAWETHTNQALENAGFECRVDCRSHAAKELDREPQVHLGYQAIAMERRGEQTELGNLNREIAARNELRQNLRLEQEQKLIQDQVSNDSTATIEPIDETAQITLELNQIPEPENTQQALKLNHPEAMDASLQQLKQLFSQAQNPNFSLDDRKTALDKTAHIQAARLETLKHQINLSDNENTKARLQLLEELEKAYYTENTNQLSAQILKSADPRKYVNDIAASQHRARVAKKTYQENLAIWNYRAVRDPEYIARDEESKKLITERQAIETKACIDFAAKVALFNWDESRIEMERQKLEQKLEYDLAEKFGLEVDYDYGLNIERSRF